MPRYVYCGFLAEAPAAVDVEGGAAPTAPVLRCRSSGAHICCRSHESVPLSTLVFQGTDGEQTVAGVMQLFTITHITIDI